jgi:D-sedoheptulose 7-phosphate isomerase
VLTAWSNDCSFDTAFARQVDAYGKPGDVAWGISTSGNSKNVIRALETARERGLSTIGLAGNNGGAMAQSCDVLMAIESRFTPRVQEIHLVTYHAICEAIENALFGDEQ